MNRIPRLLPLVGVALGGVLAIKALSEVDILPKALAGARAFAQDAGKPAAPKTAKPAASATPPAASVASAAQSAAKVCAPTAVDLARDAGLSPAELQVLQSLGTRRTQLDQREQDLDTQLKLLAAAEAKLDLKLKGLNGLKADLQALLTETDTKESAEIDRLVIVYSKMKPHDAAAVMTQLEDKVRIPVAAKMKEAALAAVLSQMAPGDAKKLTESLAHRFDKIQEMAQAAANPAPATPDPLATPPPSATPDPKATPAKPAAAKSPKPTKVASAKARARRRTPSSAAAAATKALAQAAAKPATPAVTPVSAPAAATPVAKPAA